MRVTLAGATGMVGGLLLERLRADAAVREIHVVGRRPPAGIGGDARLRFHQTDFGNLSMSPPWAAADRGYCCLGTTLRAAGGEAAFRAVDHDLVLEFAHLARQAGAQRFVLVSAAGAEARSRLFYLRVKGETERDLEALRFAALDVMQPALLLGARREFRLGESLARLVAPLVNPLLIGRLSAWRAVDAGELARAMLAVTRRGLRGVRRHGSPDITRLARAGAPTRVQL